MSAAREFIDRARLGVACVVIVLGEAIAPGRVREVMRGVRKAGAGIPAQILDGREGGVVIVPWHITDEGRRLADSQAASCGRIAASIRDIRERMKRACLS